MHVVRIAAVAAVLAGLASPAFADVRLKPFILAERTSGEVSAVGAAVKAKLVQAGFEVAGAYEPYPDALVIVVTSDDLKAAAAQNRFGAYGAGQRVTVTKVGDEVQVAFTSPIYMAVAYRMTANLAPVAGKLASALGRIQEYGPDEGKTARDLRRYHYMVGMQYFDDPSELGKFPSQAEAVQAVEAGLAAGRGGTRKVYRIDVPGGEEAVFGVALSEGCSGDAHIMKEIDFKPVRSTGHLPYELVVSRGEVYALHARFRIAVNFTDLSMMGDHSFMNIRCAPGAIEGALKQVIGAKE